MSRTTSENRPRPPRGVVIGLRLQALTGWRRNLLLLLCGIGGTLSQAPFHFWPLLVISFPVLVWSAVHAPTVRRAFFDAWWFSFGFYATTIYWFAYALLVDAARFGWMIPFAVFGLAAFFALYAGVAGMGLRLGRVLSPWAWPFLAAGTWTAIDWVRGYLFTGFPWGVIGYVFTASDASLQAAAWLGVWGLGWLAVCLASLPVWLMLPLPSERLRRRYLGGVAAGAAILMLIVWLGHLRLTNHPTEYIDGAEFRLVQAGIQQYRKWQPEERLKSIEAHVALTHAPGYEKMRYIVWSETSMTFSFASGDYWASKLAELVPENGLLLTGVVRMEDAPEQPLGVRVYNSLQALDRSGSVIAAYDKRVLVPFGEFVPFRGILPVEKVTHGGVDFSRGGGPVRISLPGGEGSLYPTICYESSYAEITHGAWPSAILNITNDTWFGDSTGPYQHLAMSRMRAVEEGVPMLRDANSGVSALIDPYGRLLKTLGLNETGVLDVTLPRSTEAAPASSRYGLQAFVLLLVLSFVICANSLRSRSD